MRTVWSVAYLELREWRALPVLALAAGILLLVAAVAPPETGFHGLAAEVPVLALVAAAIAAGSSVFTRDVRDGRAAFLLARPTPTGAVWLGKLGAAIVLALSAYVLCRLPLALRNGLVRSAGDLRDVRDGFVLTLLAIGLGHWGALAFIARGWRLLADAASSVALLVALALLQVLLFVETAMVSPMHVAAAWTPALLLAGWAAVARGRGSRAASYAWFTRFHWTGLAAIGLAMGAFLLHVRAVRPAHLRHMSITAVSPRGDWLAVFGEARGRGRAYFTLLVPVEGGDFVNAGRGSFWGSAVGTTFSADGRWCAWAAMEWSRRGLEAVTRVAKLGNSEPVITLRTPPKAPQSSDEVPLPTLSPTAKGLLLTHGGGHVEVRSLAGGSTWTRDHADGAGFVDDETVWILVRGPNGRAFVTFGRERGELRREVTLGGHGVSRVALAPAGTEALLLTTEGKAANVERCDLVTGRCHAVWSRLALVPQPALPTTHPAEAAYLADGGFVIAAREGTSESPWRVRAFDVDGRPRWTIETPAAASGPQLVGQPDDGTLLVHVRHVRRAPMAEHFPLLLVHAASGRVLRQDTGLTPLGFDTSWPADFRRGRATKYFGDGLGALVRVDPLTGRREPLPLR